MKKTQKTRVHKSFYFFSPKSTKHKIEAFFKTLSFRELELIENLYQNKEENKAYYMACKLGIINITTLSDKNININTLSPQTVNEIGSEIIDKAIITNKEYTTLKESIEIMLDNKFSKKTWKCDYCKKRGLDKQRNCGYRNELNKNKNFQIMVGNKIYTSCPMYFVDKDLCSDAILAYNIFDSGNLPDEGGFYDQTKFFCIASFAVKQKLADEEKKELDKIKRENNKPTP